MKKNDFGVFEIVVKALKGGKVAIPHNSKVKVRHLCSPELGMEGS